MQYTENYNLNKPELTDVADITKLSDNMDIIDEELEKRTTKLGFLTDLITHLASDAAIAISSLSTDSVFYRLLQYALNAAGVQYNFQNSSAWYMCIGTLFGGLIIQGGNIPGSYANPYVLTYPISFTQTPSFVLGPWAPSISHGGRGTTMVTIYHQDGNGTDWLVVGR